MQQEIVKSTKVRYDALDILRGLNLISMILYHAMWDMVYIAHYNWKWFYSNATYIWQQSICWTFILLSGFCWSMSKRRLRRGVIVFIAGVLISVITLIFIPEQRVLFGVLTLLGTCMLIMIPLEKLFRNFHAGAGLALGILLFVVTRNINVGELGFGKLHLISLPKSWYKQGYGMTYLGFTDKSFFSSDYFSVFPWFFLFLTGYFLYRIVHEKKLLEKPIMRRFITAPNFLKPIKMLGRITLIVYMLHQPVIYFIVTTFLK